MNSTVNNLSNSLLNMIFRDAKLVLTVWAVCVLVALAAAIFSPKIYEAKATILVKFGREYVYRPETGNQRATAPQRTDMEEAINSEIQILASRDLKGRVITEIGIDRLYPKTGEAQMPLDLAIEQFEKALHIRGIERSNIISVYFRHSNAELAAETLNKFIQLFRTKRLSIYRDSDIPFSRVRVANLTAELRGAETAFVAFKAENQLFEVEEQKTRLIERRSRLAAELADAEKAISELKGKRSAQLRHLKAEPRQVIIYTDAERGRRQDEARQKLFDLQLRESQLLKGYKEDSKTVVTVRQEIEQIRNFLENQDEDISGRRTRTGPNEVYQSIHHEILSVEAELASLQGKSKITAAQIQNIDSEILRISSLQSLYDEKQRAAQTLRQALETQLGNLAEAQALAALDDQDKTNIRIVQEATPPHRAIGMSRTAKVLLSIPLGLLAGLGVVLLINFIRVPVSEPLAAQRRSGLDVLATVDRQD